MAQTRCYILSLFHLMVLYSASDITWYKDTAFHQENILKVENGWIDCPDWQIYSPDVDEEELSIITFGTVTRVQIPKMDNLQYNFTAKCIEIKVPLNWDMDIDNITLDEENVINYYITRIYSQHNENNINQNGAFWVLNGGPGGDGVSLYGVAIPWLTYIDATFDLYIPDHRGTGYSNKLVCPLLASLDDYFTCSYDRLEDVVPYFSTYQASMDLGYAVDLFENEMSIYQDDNTIIYGISYGTYYLNSYLNLFPDQINAAIFDGLCPPDLCRIADYDINVNNVGIEFINKCDQDEFCHDAFTKINFDSALEAMESIFDDSKCMNGTLTSSQLKPIFFRLLADQYNRILLPPIIYRMNRCNQDDQAVLQNMADVFLTSSETNVSEVLGENIVLSEMWYGLDPSDGGPSYTELVEEDEDYYMSLGIAIYRAFWDEWNKYTPNEEMYNKFADPPIPMLLLNGDLDPQTGVEWALHSAKQYNATIDGNDEINSPNRYYFTVPNAPHFVWFRSPINNYTDDTIEWDYDFETCGFYIIKSFIDPNNNFVPDGDCINWLTPIDWNGNTTISTLASLRVLGTEDMWDFSDEADSTGRTEKDNIRFILAILFVYNWCCDLF